MSLAFLKAINAVETDEVFLWLLTIESPELDDPIRLVRDIQSVVSNGETYLPYAFSLPPISQPESGIASATLTLNAVYDPDDPAINVLEMANTIQTGNVTLQLVLRSAPNVVEYGPVVCTLNKAKGNVEQLQIELSPEDLLNKKACGYLMSPYLAPGVHN